MSTSLLYHGFGLRGYRYIRTEYIKGHVYFTMAIKPHQIRCSACNCRHPQKRELCMKGRIYQNKGGYVVRFGRTISKWFKHRDAAERFLTGIRFEEDQGKLDIRDYQANKPLAFCNLSERFIKIKKQKLKPKSFANVKRYLHKAVEAWGDRNVKSIQFADIEDFLLDQNVSDKAKSNIKSALHSFWIWLRKRRVITL